MQYFKETKNLQKKGGENLFMKRSNNNEKGITLIALIITIIILVILAAVSVAAVYNMGIVNYAVNGTQNYAKASVAENEMMDSTAGYIESTVSGLNDIQSGQKKTITLAYFDSGLSFNEKPILSISEPCEYESISMKEGKITSILTVNEEKYTFTSDIISGEYPIDCFDGRQFMGNEEPIPTIIVDSNHKVVKNLTSVNSLKSDQYYYIFLTSTDQGNILLSGEYYTDYSFWTHLWSEKSILYYNEYLEAVGLKIIPFGYIIYDNNGASYESDYLASDYVDVTALYESIKNEEKAEVEKHGPLSLPFTSVSFEKVETDRYHAYKYYSAGYEGIPCCIYDYSSENFYFGGYPSWVHYGMYDMDHSFNNSGVENSPHEIRDKNTKELVSYDDVKAEAAAYETSEEREQVYSKYEYYWEEKMHCLQNGFAIVLE